MSGTPPAKSTTRIPTKEPGKGKLKATTSAPTTSVPKEEGVLTIK